MPWTALNKAYGTGEIDMVLELTRPVGHNVEKFKPVCEKIGIPFVRVARGYGVSALVEAIGVHITERAP